MILPDIKKLPDKDSSWVLLSKVKESNADSEVEAPVLLITTPLAEEGDTAEDPGAPDVPEEPEVPEVPKVLPEVPDVPLLKPIKIQIVPSPSETDIAPLAKTTEKIYTPLFSVTEL